MKSFEQIAKAMFEEWESYFVHCMERYEEVLFRRGWDGISRNEKAAWIAAAKAAHKENKRGALMEQNQQPEALRLAEKIKWGASFPDSSSAAAELRRLHARVEDLEKDLGNAKRLASKIWAKHPEARDTIEKATGAWLVFGQDVEAGGVSAQRVAQAADHIAQEPVAWRYQTSTGWHATTDASAALRVSKHHAIEPMYTAPQPQEVRELLAKDLDAVNLDRLGKALTKLGHATWVSQEAAAADIPRWVNALTRCVLEIPEAAPQPQADARDAQRYRWLIDYFISDRVDLDDAIVAAKTSEDIAKIIDAAIAAAKGAQK